MGRGASAYVSCRPVSSGSELGRADFKRSRVPPGSRSRRGGEGCFAGEDVRWRVLGLARHFCGFLCAK